jgi:hypothetical protein
MAHFHMLPLIGAIILYSVKQLVASGVAAVARIKEVALTVKLT